MCHALLHNVVEYQMLNTSLVKFVADAHVDSGSLVHQPTHPASHTWGQQPGTMQPPETY